MSDQPWELDHAIPGTCVCLNGCPDVPADCMNASGYCDECENARAAKANELDADDSSFHPCDPRDGKRYT